MCRQPNVAGLCTMYTPSVDQNTRRRPTYLFVVGLYCAAYHSHMPQMKQVLTKFEVEDGDLDCVLCAG